MRGMRWIRNLFIFREVERHIMLKYIMVTSSGLESGVIKKAIAQVSGLNALGLASELIIISDHSFPKLTKLPYYVTVIPIDTIPKADLVSRFIRMSRIRRALRDTVLSLDQYDILYCRGLEFQLSYYPLAFFKHSRRCKIISEHQSIEIRQALLYKSYLSALRDLLTGGFITAQSDGIIGVTDEITSFWSRRLFCRKIPHTTIPNGFNVHSVRVRKPPSNEHTDLHLLFVGNVSRWHGLDRIIRGTAGYRGSISVHVHIVGNGDELQNLQDLKRAVAQDADIHFHDIYIDKQLDAVFDECHIAIGSLGLHRNGMSQATSLKVREYCSRGIPFILSNQDPDFPETFEYCLQVEPTETPIDMEKVVSFAIKMCNDPDHPQIMRKYAEENLDWNVKVKEGYRFINNVLKGV